MLDLAVERGGHRGGEAVGDRGIVLAVAARDRAPARTGPQLERLARADPAPHVAGVEESGPGRRPPPDAKRELRLSPNLPRFNRGDLVGILIAIVGTIATAVLAATGPPSDSAGGAAQILIAIALALINMAHVVGLLLFESVHYRGGFQRFFRDLSMTATPLAIVVVGAITLFD